MKIAVFGSFSDPDYTIMSKMENHFGWNNCDLEIPSDCRRNMELEFNRCAPEFNPGKLFGVCSEYEIPCRAYYMMERAVEIKFILSYFKPINDIHSVLVSVLQDHIESATAAEFYLAVKLFRRKIVMPNNYFDEIANDFIYDDFVRRYESQVTSPNPVDYSFPYFAYHLVQSREKLNNYVYSA